MNKIYYIYVRIRVVAPIATVELWLLCRTDNSMVLFARWLRGHNTQLPAEKP